MDEDIKKELYILDNYLKNQKLRKEIQNGTLISVESLLVLNDKDYIWVENNKLCLTKKGLANIDNISYGAIRKENDRMTRLLTYYYKFMLEKYEMQKMKSNMLCGESNQYLPESSAKMHTSKNSILNINECVWKTEITKPTNKFLEEESFFEKIAESYNSDPTFSEAVIEMMEIKKLKGPDCYNKAGVNRDIFSKIQRKRDYIPTKSMCISLCFGMELNSWDTEHLLKIGGYALGNILFDRVCSFFLGVKNYDVESVNEILSLYSCTERLGSK